MTNPSPIPATATLLGESPEFTAETVPAALLSRHELAPDRWAQLKVLAGSLRFFDLKTNKDHAIQAGESHIIAPSSPHRVAPEDSARFQLHFYGLKTEEKTKTE